MHIDKPNGHRRTCAFFLLQLLQMKSFELITYWINFKSVLYDIHGTDENRQNDQSDDSDVSNGSGYCLTNDCLTCCFFTMNTRITLSKTLTCIVQKRGSTDTLVEAFYILAKIHLNFTMFSYPSTRTRTIKSRSRCFITGTSNKE